MDIVSKIKQTFIDMREELMKSINTTDEGYKSKSNAKKKTLPPSSVKKKPKSPKSDVKTGSVKSTDQVPNVKGQKKYESKKDKKKEEKKNLTDEQKKAVKAKEKTSMEERTASVPGIRRTAEGKTSFYGRTLGAKKIVPKKKRHVVEQAIRTVRTPTKRATILKKSDDFTIKGDND